MDNQKEKQINLITMVFRLRSVVLALGETTVPSWWRTEFMNETGMRFLERLYPRTTFQAAVHATGRAACDVHDRAVGRVGVYHLFRLPESMENEMKRMPPDSDENFFLSLRAALGQQDKLLELLAAMSNSASITDVVAGAKRIGTDKDLMTRAGFEKTAGVYIKAFMRKKSAYPYFIAEQAEDPR